MAVATPLPLSVATGGRELQALRTLEALRALGVSADPLDHWATDRRHRLLHCFGSEPGLWEMAARSRPTGVRIVVSPVLVFGRSTSAFRAWALVDRFVPMRTSFRYRRDLVRLADAVIALTQTERHLLESVYGVAPSRCHVVPNGVDESFRNASPDAYREQFGSEPFVLCVGSVEARKRQIDVVRAAERARRRVVFIGEVRRDDPYGAAFLGAVSGASEIVWHRSLPPGSMLLASAYAAADAVVLMSEAEGMPLVALEGRAAGCALVLSDLPQHVEAFPGATFVRIGDEMALATAIAGASRSAGDARQAAAPWTWEQVAREIRRIYHEIDPELAGVA